MDTSGDQSDEQQAEEKPVGMEEQRTIESQQAQAEISTEDVNELSPTTEEIIGKPQEETKADIKQNVNEKPKPKLKDPSKKLFDQFTKHFLVSKIASGNTNNMLKQIQKQLTQIDKTTSISNKQQIVLKQLVVQVKVMQKKLDVIKGSINRNKNISNIKRKGASNKRTKK